MISLLHSSVPPRRFGSCPHTVSPCDACAPTHTQTYPAQSLAHFTLSPLLSPLAAKGPISVSDRPRAWEDPLYLQCTAEGRIAYGTGLTPPPSPFYSLASVPPLSFEKYHAGISHGSTRAGNRSPHLAAGLSVPPHRRGDTWLAEQIHLGRAMRGGWKEKTPEMYASLPHMLILVHCLAVG